VKVIFGIPGEENLDFIEALRQSSIELVVTRHEQAAGMMAATYGRLTGKAGVCLSTLGPGATNLVTAAAYAQLGAMPMVMITGQKPILSSKQGQFQIVDVVDMMQPLTKYSHQIQSGNSIPANVREAFRQANTERPGAAHLELPEDIAREQTDARVLEQGQHRRPIAEPKAIHAAVKMIEEAKRPLILVGAGANRKRAGRAILEFIERTGIYFINTQMGKGVVDERHPQFLGTAALSDGDYVHCAIEQADLIINVGHDVVEKPPFFMTPDGFKVLHVNFTNAQIDPVYFPQADVVGDIASSIEQMAQMMTPSEHWDFGCFERVKALVSEDRERRFDAFPPVPQTLVQWVRDAMPEEGIVALDNGLYKIWFARNYLAYGHNTLLLDNALATMGAGLPSAIAAKRLNPDVPVMAVCGDGGFMMSVQELVTAVRLQLDLVVLVLNDNAFGMIAWKQQNMALPSWGLSLENPDFVQLANSFGAIGHRLQAGDDAVNLIHACFEAGGVHLIEIPVDYQKEGLILEALKQKAQAAMEQYLQSGS
jgi:acetolactate synthase-1/2/3 large subunit